MKNRHFACVLPLLRVLYPVMDFRIVHESQEFLIVEKPAGMHTAPLREGEGGTLLDLVLERFPEIASVPGIKPVEPGLLHRLDRETSGLVLIARTAAAFEFLLEEAREGRFRKRYTAISFDTHSRGGIRRKGETPPGAESPSAFPEWPFTATLEPQTRGDPAETVIRSAFRPYGPGRIRVAPVRVNADDVRRTASRRNEATATAEVYETRILSVRPVEKHASDAFSRLRLRVELTRGFRHQVRCHLAAAGYPIAGDPLYLSPDLRRDEERLELYADGLSFISPETGRPFACELRD